MRRAPLTSSLTNEGGRCGGPPFFVVRCVRDAKEKGPAPEGTGPKNVTAPGAHRPPSAARGVGCGPPLLSPHALCVRTPGRAYPFRVKSQASP